jgi:hypothetical protein
MDTDRAGFIRINQRDPWGNGLDLVCRLSVFVMNQGFIRPLFLNFYP